MPGLCRPVALPASQAEPAAGVRPRPAGAGHLPLPADARRDRRCAAGRHRPGRPGRLLHPVPRLDPPRPATTRPAARHAIRVVARSRTRRPGLIDTRGPRWGCPRRPDSPTWAPLS
ncbi:hypothetical protein B5D80_20510 [Micromonospora wenchangensis]|uniref:Uncharacterized protein n=1 Tax=Micromonospora wenchangensis TaxID=1185415 RepID=A0A246RID9_9ACTN|nr:hypothetical protein B5D80_20510 [Micromonospora wenchangensis]